MKRFVRVHWKTLLFFAVVGLVGGFFTGIYVLDGYPAEIQQMLQDELNASGLGQLSMSLVMGLLTAVQSAGYGLILGAAGICLAGKIGLWRGDRSITRKPLLVALSVALVGGLVMILSDTLFFGRYSEAIRNSYTVKPTLVYLLASVTYAAVIEEVMLRLFMMSLIAFVLHKLFGRKQERPAAGILCAANVMAAVLFAAGHLPATIMMIGTTPMIIFRCFALNGGLGLLFGWLYRKYGLRYAMMAHGGCHVVSKLIWILFI